MFRSQKPYYSRSAIVRDLYFPAKTMSDLSPKLLERRRLREIRCRPWKDIQPASPVPISRRSILGNPVITSSRIPILRKSYPLPNRPVPESIKAEYKRSGPFPFLKLPVEIQLLVGEYVVQYQTSIKCKGIYSIDLGIEF